MVYFIILFTIFIEYEKTNKKAIKRKPRYHQ